MAPDGVVEAVDVLASARVRKMVRQMNSDFNVLKNVSTMALSKAFASLDHQPRPQSDIVPAPAWDGSMRSKHPHSHDHASPPLNEPGARQVSNGAPMRMICNGLSIQHFLHCR
jgi:hypothetical protein